MLIQQDVASFYSKDGVSKVEHDKLTTSISLHLFLGIEPSLFPQDKLISKSRLKLPMIILAWQAGMYSGIAVSFLKCFAESIKSASMFNNME